MTSLCSFAQTVIPITVTVTPGTASVTGGGTQQFMATVLNTANPSVTWTVNGVAGGNAALGTISAKGLYTALPTIAGQVVRVITAVSQADKTKSGSANLTLLPVTISLLPGPVTLLDGQTQQFTATVANTANTAVTWLVNGVAGGSATTGTITAQGLYSAPPIIAAAVTAAAVKAVSQADTTRVATAYVTLKGVGVTVAPTAVSLTGAGKQQFTATLENSPNPGLIWRVNGIAGGNATVGTVSATGLYQAPTVIASQTIVRVLAVSQLDIRKAAIANVTLLPVAITATPLTATLIGGGTQQFAVSVLNTSNTAVVWKVNGVVGGNAALGAITTAGLYSAPASLASATTVTVAAVSQADPTKSATAQVTITPVVVKPVTIAVTPATVSLNTSATQQFAVSVLNTTNTAVVWKVNGVVGGNAALGTISTAGLYSAPASLAAKTTVTVAAVAQADPTKSATAQVTITPVVVKPVTIAVTPVTASLTTGATQQFAVVVLNTANIAVVWKVNGVIGGNATLGTIGASGLYSAPASLAGKTTVTVAAVAQADTTKSATAQVTVTPPPPTTAGNAFYVAATGNDANPGTLASPGRPSRTRPPPARYNRETSSTYAEAPTRKR